MKQAHIAQKTKSKLKLVYDMLKGKSGVTIEDINASLTRRFGGSVSTNWIAATRRAVAEGKTLDQFLDAEFAKAEKHEPVIKNAPVSNVSPAMELKDVFALLLQKARPEGYDRCSVNFESGEVELHRPERERTEVVPEVTHKLQVKG